MDGYLAGPLARATSRLGLVAGDSNRATVLGKPSTSVRYVELSSSLRNLVTEPAPATRSMAR
jgi:hypothetical protein